MEINQYTDIFIEESNEHLQSMNDCLLKLESEPENIELLNEIFRVSHTLKGMAATMGFEQMSKLTHQMENLLQELRSEKISIDTKIVDILFECLDNLENYIKNISELGNEGDLETEFLVDKINNILFKDEKDNTPKTKNEDDNYYINNILMQAKKDGLNAFNITITIDDNCMLKAARAFIVFNALEDYGEIIKSIPSSEDIEDEKFDNEFEVLLVTNNDNKTIYEELTSISEVSSVIIKSVIDDKLEKEKSKKENVSNNKSSDIIKGKNTKNNISNKKIGKTVRVDIERLDNLMNLVSELIIIKTRMEDIDNTNSKESMSEATEYLERITTNLHDAVMKVRMVPIERVFNRFPRMVRDLSKDLGKEIELKMIGEETEVDRTVIDEIGDPLIHLIRNSIDHGIETPSERKKNKKAPKGTLLLKAFPDGNNVVIEVQDDGNGIDIERVKEKAINNSIISTEAANQMDDNEVPELLFMPGFSTTDEITDISGRGVGLDVVKSKINSIGGIVEIETEEKKYTKFTIRIPLTLAIIQALLIKLKEEIYAIPLSSIKEITTIESNNIRKIQNKEVILYRNKTLPIVRLNKVLDIESEEDKKELIIVIVKKGEKEAGVVVDQLIGQQEIVIKSLGKYLAKIKHLAGATILGNGSISLIIDTNSLF
ncbi:chemotaxis protein CheA [Senegalia massiliensis]|uniref:Chemotaxis protein CheA n=1 Tax=Senegalia massiliensis TaxID=1720316 RepID=A0A845R0C1_9CLOT|nr:chemotaxis protein CheA [Senegalia massiliensis]NBI07880.1 chemotaxis protein CheA [Senegalia massiliensis]